VAGSLRYRQVAEVNTIDSMVAPGPPGSAAGYIPPPRRRRKWPVFLVLGLLLIAAASFVTLPYYSVSPGSARQVNDLINVPNDRAYPPRGKVFMATVSLQRATPVDALVGWLDSDTEVVPEDRILGGIPRSRYSEQNRELMTESKEVAKVVALRQLGFPVTEHGSGGLVMGVEEGSPAEGHLSPGDVIAAVDGRPTALATEAVNIIRSHRPGEVVRLDLRNGDGAPRTEQVSLAANPRRPGGFLGVTVLTKDQRFDYPFPVDIESGEVGGPSAGLAYTLGVLDTLTPGELTGGKRVATTGTMEIDGIVGNVGGVAQKTTAVRAAGAEYFLVPPDEYEEALSHAGDDLKVMKAGSLSEALAVLAGLGGDVSALGKPPVGRGR
jgi:PDZ domain-containing protein